MTRIRCDLWLATGRRNCVTSGHSVSMRWRLVSTVSMKRESAKRRGGCAAAEPGAATFSLEVASCASDEKHCVDSAVRKWEIASSSRRAEPEKRLSSAVERIFNSLVVPSGPPTAVASSTARAEEAVVFEEAMIRSSCSKVCRMRFHASSSSPPMQCAMLNTALSACTFFAERVVLGSGSYTASTGAKLIPAAVWPPSDRARGGRA
mmetsp:Transcript_38183/g.94941  ORF Transcript_38183/g.94941 Transcript_38183/m.94941 type:complete len:206 (+) Transcript_38183:1388-2005(+)